MRPGLSLDFMKLGAALLGVAAVGSWFLTMPEQESEGAAFTRPAVTALLVDTSASVTRARQGWKKWAIRAVQREVKAAGLRGDELALVTFDAEVRRRAGPVDAEVFLAGITPRWFDSTAGARAELATDLEGAARAAAALLSEEGRAPGSIIVFGDGVPTGEDPSAVLLRDPDWTLALVEPPPPDRVDLGVIRTIAPEKVAPGIAVPVQLDCVLKGPGIRRGTRVFVDWEIQVTGTDSATRGAELAPPAGAPDENALGGFVSGTVLAGTSEITLPDAAAAGGGDLPAARPFRARFSVPGLKVGTAMFQGRLRLEGVVADPFPENDVARARWIVGDPVRVVVCAPPEAVRAATMFFTGPAFDGIEFRGVNPDQLGDVLAAGPEELPDAVVSIELPFAGLPGEALVAFVEERGGGWLHSAGWPLTSVSASPLRAIAALEADLTPKPPRDIVFFVDGSGSMQGERWYRMREALRKLLPSVPATDTLSLRFFTRTMGREELRFPAQADGGPETATARDEALRRLLRMRVPGGATDIVGSLFELARARESREHHDAPRDPEREAGGAMGPLPDDGLVVLISDGETRSINERRKTARARLAAGRDEFVAIHVGDGKGVTFLKGLLRKGEEVVVAGELEGLLDLLQEAILDLSVVEGARLVPAEPPEGTVASSRGEVPQWWGPMLRGVQGRIPEREPIVVARAIPAQPAEGAVAVLELVSEALKLQGRTSTFAAAAVHGRGWTVGLAAPLVDEGADSLDGTSKSHWAPELRGHSGWLAPLFRTAAHRRDAADEALRAENGAVDPTVAWTLDPRLLFGPQAPVRGPALLFENLLESGPLELVAEFEVRGRVLVRAPARFLPGARDPRSSRAVPSPCEVMALPAGAEFWVSLVAQGAPGKVVAGPFPLHALGPQETRAMGDAAVAPALVAARSRSTLGRGMDRRRTVAGGAADGEDRRGHPGLPWLLAAGLGSFFVGAALACRGR